MKKFLPHFGTRVHRGSALITTLLMTSLIMLIALGIAQLIAGDLKTGAEFVREGKALYMAEAGLERGLLELKQKHPGFQPKPFSEALTKDLDASLIYDLEFLTQATELPVEDGYRILEQQRSVAIPLFNVDKDNVPHAISDFLVKYYVPFKENIQNAKLQDIDLLRWKIVGINNDNGNAESISDFTAASDMANKVNPNCFGTKLDLADSVVKGNCIPDTNGEKVADSVVSGAGGSVSVKHLNCKWDQARSHYTYVPSTDFQGSVDVLEATCYSIRDFLAKHSQSYLILTNLVNPDIIETLDANQKFALSKINYRVLTSKAVLRDQVVIRSTGHFGGVLGVGGSKKSLDLSLGGDIFLPVFNFSIYRTDNDK